jgi:hypothetical protein
MTFPNSIEIATIDRKHPVYASLAATRRTLDLLNDGGSTLRNSAGEFLTRKVKEPSEVYNLRLKAFTYENILGPILDWYRARMAGCHAEISLTREKQVLEGGLDAEWYAGFLANCERPSSKRRVALSSFLADRFKDLITHGAAYTLVDKPKTDFETTTRFAQRSAGLLDPYLVPVYASELIDWSSSEDGELEYAVLYCEREQRQFGISASSAAAWYVYDREGFAHYETPIKDGKPDGKIARLVDFGPHALTELKRVPILPWYAAKGQWLADRASLSLTAHLDLLNANRWSMINALLPMLVIICRFDDQAVRGETAYLNLPEGGDAKYLSPDSAIFTTAHQKLMSLKEEAYRQMHVQAQARTASATAQAQSGVSKQEDMTAATEVLNGFGADMRDYAHTVMSAVIAARGDEGIMPVVAGWTFDAPITADTLDAAERCDVLEIGSDTFDREMKKRVVRAAVPDLPANTLQVIDREIDSAPTREERKAKEAESATSALKQMAQGSQPEKPKPSGEDDAADQTEDE